MNVYKAIFFSTLFLIFSCSIVIAQQEKNVLAGFGIESGVGYTIMKQCTGFWGTPMYNKTFMVQPTGRIFYAINLYNFPKQTKIEMPCFIGYNTFGSKTINTVFLEDPSLSRPTTVLNLFRSFEAGINPCIEKNKFQFFLVIF